MSNTIFRNEEVLPADNVDDPQLRLEMEMGLIHEKLSYQVLGAAIEVHKELGPGLLESIYHECMSHELSLRGIAHENHVPIPLTYKGLALSKSYEGDIVVEGLMILELKSVATLLPVHDAQLLTYMKLLNVDVGYLLNFNVGNLVADGRRRFVL